MLRALRLKCNRPLARAEVPPEAPQVVAEQPEAEPPQAEPAQAGQSEPQAQPPQAEPAQEPPKPTKLPADQGSVAAASASAASSSSYHLPMSQEQLRPPARN